MTFQRMADRRPVLTGVTRDDGVVFTLRGAGGGSELPHDLVHALAESELGIRDGIWGCIADGVVWGSMTHVSGRQRPHARERSERLKRERRGAVHRAETIGDVADRLHRCKPVGPDETHGVPTAQMLRAVDALNIAWEHWKSLAPGESWELHWR